MGSFWLFTPSIHCRRDNSSLTYSLTLKEKQMSPKKLLLSTLLFFTVFNGIAQDKITAPSPSNRSAIELYDHPGAVEAVRQISVAETVFPLNILDAKSGFYKVSIQGQDFWLRGLQVRISRDSNAGCGTAGLAKIGATIATPGAGKDACK